MQDQIKFLLAAAVVAAAFFTAPAPAHGQDGRLDTAKIEQLTGAKGKLDETEGVFKVSVPRSDLNVTTAGVKMTPPLGLTTWAAFKNAGEHAVVMSDNVLTEDQVNTVMDAALQNGLEVTALHNHFFWDQPKVMFMHVGGMGDADKLAAAIGKVFAASKATRGDGAVRPPIADIDSSKNTFDAKSLDGIFNAKGETSPNGVYKVTIAKPTKMNGHEMGAAMGVNTWAAFAGNDDRAVVDGDFAMYEDELQGVLKALRGHGISIVAIHNHMTMENPRVVFLHYWGVGPAGQLASGVKAALDTQGHGGSHASGGADHN
jgi:hypothetical protein